MGFYVRKSLRAGPFRFNVSKSGLGVSAGVPGFRVGTGPRGNYVHAGSHGVYYRASLGGKQRKVPASPGRPPAQPFLPPAGSEIALEDVTGASAVDLVSTEGDDLVEQLNDASSRWRLAPWVLLGTMIAVGALPTAAGAAVLLLGVAGTAWLWLRDRARRSVVTFYQVEDRHAQWFAGLVEAFEALSGVAALWRVNASGRVRTTYEYKTNSGASDIVSRAAAKAGLKGPAVLVTNIAVPSISCGRHALHFLPDRLLVRDGKRFSDVPYVALNTDYHPQRFIESGRRPRDSQQVDTTWRYVNVKGGPDRRYKDNRQLPVMLYGEVEIETSSGLHWLLQCSKPDAAENVSDTVRRAPDPAQAMGALGPSETSTGC
jgi:hypothetical protein